MSELIGKPIDRVDGRLKVTGGATYSAEYPLKNLAYGVTVQSTIAKGRIANINTAKAERASGVVKVITYKNALSLHFPSADASGGGKYGEKDLLPLQSDRIFYNGQHIAVVVAETLEEAEYAASLITVDYDKSDAALDISKEKPYPAGKSNGQDLQMKRGDAEAALQNASTNLMHTYTTPVYHHNPMEPHATIAEWDGDKLTIYDATQSVIGSKGVIAGMLGIQPENVRLISLYLGGGFGCKGFSWPHSTLAPMVAKIVNRPVKIVLSRQQMFTSNGRRAQTIQQIGLGADSNGKLTAIKHATTSETSFVDEFPETAGVATKMLYDSETADVSHNLVRLNRGTPCPMRAPGEAPGTYAIEAAMDELAYQLKIDPIKLRLINYAEKEPEKGKEWSAKYLKECYERGAKAIGWAQRNPEPGSMRQGKYLVGYGMATATYPANRSAASAKVQLFADGHAETSCASQDIGTGTYTILTQITAEALGLPLDKVKVKIGDSDLPKSVGSGGSQTSASAGSAVRAAALGVVSKAVQAAINDSRSPLHGYKETDIIVGNGRIFLKDNPDKGEAFTEILNRNNMHSFDSMVTTNVSTRAAAAPTEKKPEESNNATRADEDIDRKPYAFHSFGAQFAKVLVDPDLGTIHVVKLVSIMDIGKVLNAKTAKSQIMGGMIFAMGMALMEETAYDPATGRVVTRDLAQYLVPVHADMPEFEVQFIDKPDPVISPIGSRGIGEIGITGTTAAIVNAIYHATGKRVRDLPVTPDKLLS
jgi:xanthine dehydrogenase YagR molybdenum-binding subunit